MSVMPQHWKVALLRQMLGALSLMAIFAAADYQVQHSGRHHVQVAAGMMSEVWSTGGHKIQAITLVGGRILDDVRVLDIAKIDRGEPLTTAALAEIQTRLEEDPWIEMAMVRRIGRQAIEIQIREHSPQALWAVQGKVYVVNGEVGVLSEVDEVDLARRGEQRLPLVTGRGAEHEWPGLRRLIEVYPQIRDAVTRYEFVGDRRWNLTLKTGAVIKMPENVGPEVLGNALHAIQAMAERSVLMATAGAVIDLRVPGRAYISGIAPIPPTSEES